MSANTRNSLSRTLLLVLLGFIATLAGVKSLVILVPAAMLVWFGDVRALRRGRN
ncbi:MAG TPA: hypothetical protein VGG04_14615 [Candidatus Sulfotelmatobacter sp.]|jgi:hypothetical protein